MSHQTFTVSQAEALAAKLNAIDFTDDERAMLLAAFRAGAEGAEVEGFTQVSIGQVNSTAGEGGSFLPGLLGVVLAGLGAQQAKQRGQKIDQGLQ